MILLEITTYNKPKEGRIKVFLTTGNDKTKPSVYIGNSVVVNEQGIQFYIDDYVATQFEKCELYLDGLTPKLQLKDGEELNIPSEEEKKQREIDELERKLRELRGEEESEDVVEEINNEDEQAE